MKFQKGSMFSGRFRRLELLNMGIFDKMNQVSRNVAESSKSAAETSNLKKKNRIRKGADSGSNDRDRQTVL